MNAAGRRLVVVSPGSRSTPLVLAFAAEPSFELVDVIDERAAAFFALGHARATGEAAIVLATSGTAPAHWYPAILEAEAAGLPLVCVSANRPTALMGCGAPQTIDQHGLFGRHVAFFADLGDPRADAGWLRHAQRTARRALAASAEGPVHLDVRFDKPLEPSEPADATDLAARAVVAALAERAGPSISRGPPSPPSPLPLARRIAEAEAPIVLAGPLPAWRDPSPIRALAEALGAPLAAEWASQLRGSGAVHTLDLLLGAGGLPSFDLVLQFGATPTASAYERWVHAGGRPLPRIAIGRDVADVAGTAEQVVLADPSDVAAALVAALPARPARSPCPLAALEQRARGVIAELTDAAPLSEGAVVRAAFASLPEGGQILLGNSLPIRLADRHAHAVAKGAAILAQRGANGIDGLVAGALGAAHRGRPTLALLGDVTTLHDVGSFALARRLAAPLVLVVIDNGGGRIFEQLPLGSRADLASALPHFTTEHGVDLAEVARAFGLRASVHERLDSLVPALAAAFADGGTTVLVTRTPPHDAALRERRIRERVHALR